MLGRPDAQVCLRVAAVHQDLRLRPFLGAADIRRGAENLLDADHDAVRPVCLDMVGAILEGRWGLRPVWGAGKLAVRELRRLADVVLDHLDKVALNPERLAWADSAAAALTELQDAAAAPALYKPGAGRFAA